jgi:hypothetical protein
MSPLRWTTKSLRTLAKALQEQGHQVSGQIVRRLLRVAGYSLQANSKTLEGRQHADRDARFGYLADQGEAHLADGQPWSASTPKEVATRGRTSRVNSQVGGPTLVGGVVPGQYSMTRARSDVRRW